MGYSSEFYNRAESMALHLNTIEPYGLPADKQLVGQADIGQTRGADLRHPTYDFSYSHPLMPVCPGHYNYMYLYGNPRIGMWYPRLDENEAVVLVWFGNSFKIVHESECNYCLHSEWRERDGVRPIEMIDITLKSR